MQVKELIYLLKDAPPDAHVVVGSDVVHDIDFIRGRVEIGYYNPRFTKDAKGKEIALVFIANSELSDGSVESMPR